MMKKENYILHWRTAPRSVLVLLRWFPYFYKYQDEDYNLKVKNMYLETSPKNEYVRPTRRKIVYDYEKNEMEDPAEFTNTTIDKFSMGFQPGNDADKESRARQVVATASQVGLMHSHDAKLTEMGEKVVRGTFSSDDLIRQLLKMFIVSNDNEGVFPFKTFLTLINKYEYLSRNEMSFIFGVLEEKDTCKAEKAVEDFRNKYDQLSDKNKDSDIKFILKETWNKYFPLIKNHKLDKTIRIDYTDAFTRYLIFTDLFISEGRGSAAKIRINPVNSKKVKMLISGKPFLYPPKDEKNRFVSSKNQSEWFGKTNNLELPWEDKRELMTIVKDKIDTAKSLPNLEISESDLKIWDSKLSEFSINDLRSIEGKLDVAITNSNINNYIKNESQTCKNREEILHRYDLIKQNEDEAALWMEVNTWKAFVSMHGDSKKIIPNFKMNNDLTPKSFAPGRGNTPDMEIYFGSSVIIPEVSLMTGVQQWEHEGSSVIDHVMKKIQTESNKKVLGLFISSAINYRTCWQFFILNRESWMGRPVPVVPMKLDTFVGILKFIYKNDLTIEDFNDLIWEISCSTFHLKDFHDWSSSSDQIIKKWKVGKK